MLGAGTMVAEAAGVARGGIEALLRAAASVPGNDARARPPTMVSNNRSGGRIFGIRCRGVPSALYAALSRGRVWEVVAILGDDDLREKFGSPEVACHREKSGSGATMGTSIGHPALYIFRSQGPTAQEARGLQEQEEDFPAVNTPRRALARLWYWSSRSVAFSTRSGPTPPLSGPCVLRQAPVFACLLCQKVRWVL